MLFQSLCWLPLVGKRLAGGFMSIRVDLVDRIEIAVITVDSTFAAPCSHTDCAMTQYICRSKLLESSAAGFLRGGMVAIKIRVRRNRLPYSRCSSVFDCQTGAWRGRLTSRSRRIPFQDGSSLRENCVVLLFIVLVLGSTVALRTE